MSHSNISIFVTHIGCPNQCSFCNQRHITGSCSVPTPDDVKRAVENAQKTQNFDKKSTEIAFFGGSFTAIDEEYMLSLLKTAGEYVNNGTIGGIRISTRPDCIDKRILEILKSYGVTAIELGAQSMCDEVLSANRRGHSAEDVVFASKLIKEYGFELGLQMMTGLFRSDDEKDIFTAHSFIKIKPDTVRIYPTIVLKNTELEGLFLSGEYAPQSLDGAVKLCRSLNEMFEDNGIKVIRIGLHSIDIDAYVAGPWHPSFGELCEAESYRKIIDSHISECGEYKVFVNPAELSKAIGQRRSNIEYFKEKNIKIRIVPDISVMKRDIKVEEVK